MLGEVGLNFVHIGQEVKKTNYYAPDTRNFSALFSRKSPPYQISRTNLHFPYFPPSRHIEPAEDLSSGWMPEKLPGANPIDYWARQAVPVVRKRDPLAEQKRREQLRRR